MASSENVSSEAYDLLLLVDATYSMSDYLESLQSSLPQIISISTLTCCFERIGLLAYRDYCDEKLLEWSGWLSTKEPDDGQVDLMACARNLVPNGGGDGPEATKTGLARAYELMRADATTIILIYTDAPPHTLANGRLGREYSQLGPELEALKRSGSYGGYGPKFVDWVSAAKTLSKRIGDKKAQVFTILARNMGFFDSGYYHYLSTMTGGACFYLKDSKPASISKVTVEILLAWMGVEKPGAENISLPAFATRYISGQHITKIKHEQDQLAASFFATKLPDRNKESTNITKVPLSLDVLKKYLPKKSTLVQDFAKRYTADDEYKKTAVEHLRKLIHDDVAAISLNPVFGSLWRTVCNDRSNEARDELITAFGLEVDRITNEGEKSRMKSWLEDSYDYTVEVLETINSVPDKQRFPCVCLDPTLVFTRASETDDDDDDKAITLFRRDELLEIGRSCDYRILRRLGRVLTRLTYINSAEEMPDHIAATSEKETPKIPMALATAEHKRKFWKILLHIVVPGTMLAARPAALLAALSIRLGIQPLLEAADQEILLWQDRWNNLEVPETWNVSCLSLLLDADEAYRTRHEKETLLKSSDRELFERLVSYKMLESNLDTTLLVEVGWTPEKTRVSMGPVVTCQSCNFPRSVTVMGPKGKCGHCLWKDYKTPFEREECVRAHVTKDDDEKTSKAWVECSDRACRAQYVVYLTESLNVRPKCHFCRIRKKAPVVECTRCLNRVIWPLEYRPDNLSDFKCYACTSGRKTIVEVETTANSLSKENSTDWLIQSKKVPTLEVFNKRSVFHTISATGTKKFSQVELFPEKAGKPLIFHGKMVQNDPVAELKSWVSRRRTEARTCSLCFSDKRKTDLMLACGRSGCTQRICKDCLQSWYGLNGPGRIINIAALSCAFCRRTPTSRTLAKYGMGIHTVADLRKAVQESGTWISAWCQQCSHAKQYMERVCAAGAPAELKDWTCVECLTPRGPDVYLNVKECPGCKTMTERIDGCGHISCTVSGCWAHWCWFCGGRFEYDAIYGHLGTEHGGYYEDDYYDQYD